MDQQFWHDAWAKTDPPGWQQKSVNPLLREYWVADASTVFVPLCGRSPDLAWLHRQGHFVTGVELSESAVTRFFDERNIEYTVSQVNDFAVFSAERYQFFVGDFFALTGDEIAAVGKVYDRAAMVAMPAELRADYMRHLQATVPDSAELFVILLEYDQSLMKGPPFSVPETEFRGYFEDHYNISLLREKDTDFKRRGVDRAVEKAYHLTCKKA